MNTNLEYEKANTAVLLIKDGLNINQAIETSNAKIQLVNIMMGNEDIVTSDVFVDDVVRIQRESICASCEKNQYEVCMECACPLPTITNMKFKSCPLEKW